MKMFAAAAAFAVLCLALCAMTSAAFAQHVVDPAIVQAGADSLQLQAPMPAAGAEFARATAFTADGQVEVPWGALVDDLLGGLGVAVAALAAWLLRRVPAGLLATLNALANLLGQGRVDRLLETAIQYGINATRGAVKDQVLTIAVGNEVLERALEYALRHAPVLVEWAGGALALREKIIARLSLEADAAVPAPRPPMQTLLQEAPVREIDLRANAAQAATT